ncbi:unnamed protein product [Spodoptera littoralis]|uniref:Uncharacterized protein n=1 Tax=Spodoptera littoralis TaxID=7109 RepID=A0A9P0I9S0_SPOLI|nr:unnamed protein product [Spodoptera littoralis]CAH1642025.1 unnamed protein product [Spodoptera littoralis]
MLHKTKPSGGETEFAGDAPSSITVIGLRTVIKFSGPVCLEHLANLPYEGCGPTSGLVKLWHEQEQCYKYSHRYGVGKVRFVAMGILRRTDPPERWHRYHVSRIVPHPDYHAPSKYHDIALLETSTRVTVEVPYKPSRSSRDVCTQ